MNTHLVNVTKSSPTISSPEEEIAHRRLKIVLSYSGAKFYGYQWQPHVDSVQGTLSKAWNILTREDVTFVGCSRLDAKVNADHFVALVETRCPHGPIDILRALNGILKNQLKSPIFIYGVDEAPQDFHPRFSACGKLYEYWIWYGWAQHRLTENAWSVRGKANMELLHSFCQTHYLGTKDFAAFRSSDCAASKTMRTLDLFRVVNCPDMPELWKVQVMGKSFLKNMIRILVGTAVDYCRGRLDDEQIRKAFALGQRTLAGTCAPGHALTLRKVFYCPLAYQNTLADLGQRDAPNLNESV